MKKFFLLLFIGLLIINTIAKEEETISDFKEEKTYEKGKYVGEREGTTLTVKKGEGFDFKVPEIVITGKIDTKIILNKEMRILEDLENIKNILYEKEKIFLPEQYVKEESIIPKKRFKLIDKDFILKLKTAAATYETLFLDAMVGKELEKNSDIIFSGNLKTSANEIINDRKTRKNSFMLLTLYKTNYDILDALYLINYKHLNYENPYPDNLFRKNYISDFLKINSNFSAEINNYDISFKLEYDYFAQNNTQNLIFKENRFLNKINISKDFILKDENKVDLIFELEYFISDVFLFERNLKNNYNIDTLIKGNFIFDKIILEGGVKIQYFNFLNNYFRTSPYLSITYEILHDGLIYTTFNPEMRMIDYIKLLKDPFLIANEDLKPSFDNLNLETGFNKNLSFLNLNIYYGLRNTEDFIYKDEKNNNIFTFYNCDVFFWLIGIKLEMIKTKYFNVALKYEFKDIIESNLKLTYFAKNNLELNFDFEKEEWILNFSMKGKTEQYGTSLYIIPPYLLIDIILKRKISENFSVFGFINNILNNKNYLLYYYKEKGLNLGLGLEILF